MKKNLWWFAIVFPIMSTGLALLNPVPLLLIVSGLGWFFWAALTFRGAALIPAKTPRYQGGCLIFVAGAVAFGFSALFAIGHTMDPIGPDAHWFPYAFFGGLSAMLVGFIVVLTRPLSNG